MTTAERALAFAGGLAGALLLAAAAAVYLLHAPKTRTRLRIH
jgi:hypothetical protein